MARRASMDSVLVGTVASALMSAMVLMAPCALAGPITPPPGPVASTPGPEPRIAINGVNTPGDSNSIYKISQPGSYYLTGNLAGASGKHGIEISADNVTIDLMGHSLDGAPGSLSGIVNDGARVSVVVRNGTLREWGSHGVLLINTTSAMVERVIVHGCGGGGITAAGNSIVLDSSAYQNGGVGISVTTNGVISGCSARENGENGIAAGNGSAIVSCSARQNVENGIAAGMSSVIANCSAFDNQIHGISVVVGIITGSSAGSNGASGIVGSSQTRVSNCTATDNSVAGVIVGSASVVQECVVSTNASHGISVSADSIVTGNMCDGNGTDGAGAGIFVSSSDNRIEGNSCTDSAVGIDVTFAGNTIISNTCASNTLNWRVVAGNVCQVVVAATNPVLISGNAGGVSPGTTNPWANFSY